MNLIDIHAHLDFQDFDPDRAEVIKRTREAGCGVINVGVDLATSQAVVRLAEENEMMWATVGVHPTDSSADPRRGSTSPEAEWLELEKLATHDKVVAIGECGLDYFRLENEEDKKKQQEIFERQIDLAIRVDKPLMLHIREAYDDALEILKRFPGARGNAHFFAGNWGTAQKFLDRGFTLSFTGVITFTHQYDEIVEKAPLDRIMAETDSPFVAPVPYRGKRNEPLYVAEVVKRIAEIKKLPLPEAAEVLLNNAIAFIG